MEGERAPGEEKTILEALEYDDIEMLDAEVSDDEAEANDRIATASAVSTGEDREKAAKERRKRKKKKGNRNKRKGGGAAAADGNCISSINRFVLNTCRELKERKSYLVWNAVGCLGVAAVSDLVKEVNAILACGGQQTADGSRPRTGGGILWNILKARDQKAYKEIMAKGKEFEKQFRFQKLRRECRDEKSRNPSSDASSSADGKICRVGGRENGIKADEESDSGGERMPVFERIRVPVAYDDLFEEGEIV